MGRTKTPTAILKLQGTLRDDKRPDEVLPKVASFITGPVEVPKSITDEYCIGFYETQTNLLIKLNLLFPSDLPELESMTLTLQQLRQIQKRLREIDIVSNLDEYDKLSKLQIKLSNTFSSLAAKYYVSPTARAKMKLDYLDIQQKEQNLNPAEKLLNRGNK